MRTRAGGKLGVTAVAACAIDNLAATWDALDKLQPTVLAVKPPASFTLEEYATRYKVPNSTAQNRLDSALRQDNLSRVKVCLPDKAGRMVPKWCYSLVVKKGR